METTALAVSLALTAHCIYNRKEPSSLSFLGHGTVVALSIFLLASWTRRTSWFDSAAITAQFIAEYITFLLISIAVYRLSPFHALYAFPGPIIPRLSKFWMVHRILAKGGRHTKLQELHRQYGPWLRIGPNEISVNIPAAIRPIYNRLDRGPFYAGTPAKAESLITVMDRKRHLERRQAWARAVTSDALESYIHYVENRCRELKDHLLTDRKRGSVNMDQWINLFFMDLMGDMGFSGGFETMAAGKDKDGWMQMLAFGVVFVSSMGQVPWLRDIIQLLPQRGPIQTFHSFTDSKVHEIRELQKLGAIRRDILSTLLDESHGGAPLAHDEIAADATLVVVAATDTSVQTVLTLFRYLCEHTDKYNRLQQEVRLAFTDVAGSQVLDTNVLLKLEYLDACIQESLRIIPPGPFGPPRTSGPNGARILDKWIPPNTTIHVPVYTMHRDPENFIFPDQFLPERWLSDEGKDLLPCNRDAFMPFSAGYASCVGKNLALQNIKILVAHVVHSFNARLPSEFDVEKYDRSFKEYGLWSHDLLYLQLEMLE